MTQGGMNSWLPPSATSWDGRLKDSSQWRQLASGEGVWVPGGCFPGAVLAPSHITSLGVSPSQTNLTHQAPLHPSPNSCYVTDLAARPGG